jgi:hypothetical protein
VFFATNWIAHESFRPAYAHRADGPVAAEFPASLAAELDAGEIPDELRRASKAQYVELSSQAVVQASEPGQRWVIWDPEGADRWAVVREGDRIAQRAWDNWYEYENSYWTGGRAAGVDRGETSIAVYAFHVLVGHHGIFSLTPVWLLSFAGALMFLSGRSIELRGFATVAAAISVVVLTFYIFRPLADRNYGGVTNGLRWSFWLIPLWLILMLPAADAICSRRGRFAVALALLLISVVSVNYQPLNPWSHPWVFDYWTYLGWIEY